MNKRIPSLDGIRAISILAVLFDHAAENYVPWSRFGAFGVEIFFVVSGYLITRLLCMEERENGGISLTHFYLRRSIRILPPAILCIVFTVLLARLGWAYVAPHEPLFALLFARNFMPNGGPHLGHFWTLSIEEQFYLLWPLTFLLLGSNRKRLGFSVALFVLAPFWQYAAGKLVGGAQFVNWWRFDLRYQPLIAGCALALLCHTAKGQHLTRFLKSRVTAPISILLIVAGCAGLPIQAFSGTMAVIGAACFVHFATESPGHAIGGFLNSSVMVWIGQLSYSLYLWQQVFCKSSQIPWAGSFPVNLIASLTVASLSFYLVEMPLADLRRKLRNQVTPFIRLRTFFKTDSASNQTL